VQKLDRAFQRHDVPVHALVDVVDQRRHRARLAGARPPAHQHQPVVREGDALQRIGEPQLLQRRNLERDDAHHDHEARPLPQDVDAEAANARRAPRTVVVQYPVDSRPVVLVRDQAQRNRLRLFRRQRLLGQRDELSVDARAEYVAGLDVQVRRAPIDRRLDDAFHDRTKR